MVDVVLRQGQECRECTRPDVGEMEVGTSRESQINRFPGALCGVGFMAHLEIISRAKSGAVLQCHEGCQIETSTVSLSVQQNSSGEKNITNIKCSSKTPIYLLLS
jgi:hypothetical protein